MLTDRFDNFIPTTLARLPVLLRIAFDVAFTIAKWQMRRATRQNLRKLDRHLLLDIGLKPEDAYRESTKRFWQA